jgi:hypothetical protein
LFCRSSVIVRTRNAWQGQRTAATCEKIPEPDAPIVHRVGQEDPPAVFRQLHVLEVRPPRRVHADRGAHVDLVVVLEPLRPHVAPPLDVSRLPVLERPLQALVAGKADVVRDLFG